MSIDFQTPVSVEKIYTYNCKKCGIEFEAEDNNQCISCQDIFCNDCISHLSLCSACELEADN